MNAPESIHELMSKAEALSGFTLGELADKYKAVVPKDLLFEKGWIGQFIEACLGATSGSKPEPDFPDLGVELKTIPIDSFGKPLESTFVSVVPLMNLGYESWQQSVVYQKLSHVLWVPIVSTKTLPIAQRICATPILWQPSSEEKLRLQQDWEAVMEKVTQGKIEQLNARHGDILQVRPKAANAKVLTEAIGPDGNKIKTLPRGFYLRSKFTHSILKKYFQM